MRRWCAILILLTVFLARAEPPAEELRLESVRQFHAAYQAWDGSQFAAAAELSQQAATNGPPSSTNYYWLGTVHFHRMLQLQHQPGGRSNALAAAAAMNAALKALEQALKLNPRDAETHALLGALYGMKIDGHLVRAVRFGPRVAEHRKQAAALGANNPRVQYLLGACQYHTAKKANEQREALATLLRAEQLFEAEAETPAGPLDPRWGHDTCLTFIGRTYEKLGDWTKAAEYYGKALARHPADHLAQEGLARITERR